MSNSFVIINKNKKRLLLALVFFFTISISFSEKSGTLDSLYDELAKVIIDTDKVRILLDISGTYYSEQNDLEAAIKYAKIANSLAQGMNLLKFLAETEFSLGAFNYYSHSYEQSLYHYYKALNSYRITENQIGISKSLNNLGTIFIKQGELDKAIKCFNESLKIKQNINDTLGITSTLINIGSIYYYKNQYDKAIEHYYSSLIIAESLGDSNLIAYNLNNIANIYKKQNQYTKALKLLFRSVSYLQNSKLKLGNTFTNIGLVYQSIGEYEKSKEYYSKSLVIKEKNNDQRGLAKLFNNLGIVSKNLNNSEEALDYFNKAHAIVKANKDDYTYGSVLLNLGNLYYSLSYYDKAFHYLKRSLNIANRINAKTIKQTIYKVLSDCYVETKDYKKAYYYKNLQCIIKDSILNNETSKRISELEAKYENERKEKEIELLSKDITLQDARIIQHESEVKRQKLLRNALIIGSFLVLFIILLLFYRITGKFLKK